MTQELEAVFEELGLTQYLDIFVDQGFESWDIVLDITEGDLERLGVKLGHRRKLQRKIANWRGHQTGSSLTSPTKTDDGNGKLDGLRAESHDSHVEGSTKRKYRRHPKPDENAPERPPSAYVLFSNMVRDEMKRHNLSFIEIAKLVGERWQALSPADKEPFETRALQAKEKYNRELAEYRKTPEYRSYTQYLQEFKAKQAANQDPPKRTKVDSASTGHHSAHTSSSGVARIAARDADGLPTRKQRLGSNVSQSDVQFAFIPTPPMAHKASMDDGPISPRSMSHFEMPESVVNGVHARDARSRSASLKDMSNSAADTGVSRHQLPPLSDMILDDKIVNAGPSAPLPDLAGFEHVGRSAAIPDTNHTAFRDDRRIASLRHNSSSAGSSDSNFSSATNSSMNSNASSISSGSVPIHALLSSGSPAPLQFSSKPTPPIPFAYRPVSANTPPINDHSVFTAGTAANHPWSSAPASLSQRQAPRYPMSQSVSPISEPARMESTSPTHSAPNTYFPDRGMLAATTATAGAQTRGTGLGIDREPERMTGLDGVSALLRAGEIVERTTP